MSAKTPSGMRLHIGILGRRNSGKSSLLNALTGQTVSIVSDTPGTTTDPVKKPMELHDLGPVLFFDTAGIDDSGSIGSLRAQKTERILERLDIGIIVTTPYEWAEYESYLYNELKNRNIPAIIVINKCDLIEDSPDLFDCLPIIDGAVIKVSALQSRGLNQLRQAIIKSAPRFFFDEQVILADLVKRGNCAVLVVPVDSEAPKGRLILPQAQAIRDLLDNHSWSVVTQETELARVLDSLAVAPDLVVTDSQAFGVVDKTVPRHIPLTSFSILFSRLKGDLVTQAQGVRAIDALKNGDHVLIAEHCTHHPVKDDIGREKIPALIRSRQGQGIFFDYAQGHNFPEKLKSYQLVIHCGACTANRREVLSRIQLCTDAGVPITNYGMTIAYCLNILDRALEPFPDALTAYHKALDHAEQK
ncbi:MAG: [FeFe] hydrogenase H-cluster maturation GTPase HydF [Candidatus Zixiibacteriota bacterium]